MLNQAATDKGEIIICGTFSIADGIMRNLCVISITPVMCSMTSVSACLLTRAEINKTALFKVGNTVETRPIRWRMKLSGLITKVTRVQQEFSTLMTKFSRLTAMLHRYLSECHEAAGLRFSVTMPNLPGTKDMKMFDEIAEIQTFADGWRIYLHNTPTSIEILRMKILLLKSIMMKVYSGREQWESGQG